ncbi:bifunctional DNA primase/polymerase [Nonomuraea sp. SYSU D8015]|uniref:bifunctional DNA primase/polymerase n=1 Tax=Nonomuraea sp. SYSU D8015 TaxID=2593644 RepID=UPI00166120A1|nr:bifunctional DNA primase/polymerase [Nonomuraea sp. SYSU D8015]
MSFSEMRERELALAREFIANGVPVFVARPAPRSSDREFYFPKGWPEIEPDLSVLDEWRPGYAVCAVTGVRFDVIDVDPRNGGDESFRMLRDVARAAPPIRGIVSTPSGGQHYYVNQSGLRKFSPWHGIDIQAGRGFVYIPPTIRVSKTTGQRKPYILSRPIDWDALDQLSDETEFDQFTIWSDVLLRTYQKIHVNDETPVGRNWVGRELTSDEEFENFQRLTHICMKIKEAPYGKHDVTLYTHARAIGGLITGSGLDERLAREMLKATAWTWVRDEKDLRWIEYKISRSIEIGKQSPITIHDWHSSDLEV